MSYPDRHLNPENFAEFNAEEIPLQTSIGELVLPFIGFDKADVLVKTGADGPLPAAEIRLQQGNSTIFSFSSSFTWHGGLIEDTIATAKKEISLVQFYEDGDIGIQTKDYIWKDEEGDLFRTRKTTTVGPDSYNDVSETTKPARPETILAMARLAAIRINTSSKAKQPTPVA